MDKVINQIESGLKILTDQYGSTLRANPAKNIEEAALSEKERKHVAGLMRVNHIGEICAQALYQGQALTARSKLIKQKMQHCAQEEIDHLAWCRDRLNELNTHTSYLNPLWYVGSFTLGIVAGLAGDQWNLGFVEETENQVVKHLNSHFEKLPKADKKSLAILEQMHKDESLHAKTAKQCGAAELPFIIKQFMRVSAKMMTTTGYYL